MIKITIYFTDMDPLMTPNSNKTVYLDSLNEYNLISFIKHLLSLKNTKKIKDVNIVCYAGFRDPPTHLASTHPRFVILSEKKQTFEEKTLYFP